MAGASPRPVALGRASEEASDDSQLSTDVWFAYSPDRGRSWRQKHLAGPFDLRTVAPKDNLDENSHFLGDYLGLAPMGRGFAAALPLGKPYSVFGTADIFFAPIKFGRR